MRHRLIAALIFIVITDTGFAACGLLCSCSVLANGSISFSGFSPIVSGNTNAMGSFTLRCTAVLGGISADYSIALSQGNSGVYTSRTLLKSSTPLTYNLYTTTARTIIWGNGTGTTGVVTGSLPILILGGTDQVINVYGKMTGPQPLVTPGGTYTDSITITVTY